MSVKRVVGVTLIGLIAQTSVATADEQYGSFGAEVTDGSELKNYNALLDQLGHLKDFQSLGTVQPGSSTDDYAALYKISKVYVDIVRENGNATIPDYQHNSLNLSSIESFRSYSIRSMMKSEFKPSDDSCGAAVVFLYPTIVASTLQDIKPEYIEPQSNSARISALREAAQQDIRNDLNILGGMCNTVQFQPMLKDFDNFLSLLRSDRSVFLSPVSLELKRTGPQAFVVQKPKQPYDDKILSSNIPKRQFVPVKADQYAACAAVVGSVRQFSEENKLGYDKERVTNLELQFITASIVYSDVDNFEQHYPARLASGIAQMRSHPEQMKDWVPQTYKQCVTLYNSDLSYINQFKQEARNEYINSLQASLKLP